LVEFAIILPVFCLILAGIMDFGHLFYMRQVITNASREGARYGITYVTNPSGVRLPPSALAPSIESFVVNGYLANALLPADANPSVTAAGAGYSTGAKGAPLQVTVTATKSWFLVSSFVPGISDQVTLSATSVMQCE
jgi:hypothetical protein